MYCNIAAYKFVPLEETLLAKLSIELKQVALSQSIKGTILLGTEGINLILAAKKENIQYYQDFLQTFVELENLVYKYSYSSFVPFKKLSVKIRKEIVTFNQKNINPNDYTAPYITPEQLKNWIRKKQDFILLDTRNTFEVDVGTFEGAVHLKIENFRDLPSSLPLKNLDKTKPIVTFCTGGIRCEKAAAYLLTEGFKEVYQLQGGILNYFEHCGAEFYQGDCFVFDDRIAVNSELKCIGP